ncbi:hypothetical protein Ancab_007232 [Ancistrocladus abbreviatus]
MFMMQDHIVYMGALPEGEYSPASHHLSILEDVLDGSSLEESLIRSYTKSFNGFAAKLTEQEKERLSSMKDVVSVFPSTKLQPLTTRSWDFMGLSNTVQRNQSLESDIIIGVIDTGIWPESESFSDVGLGPIPKKWKGTCEREANFTCNNKLIGAKLYTYDKTMRDTIGHGTHTASMAAGTVVKNASFYGLAQGTAKGGVPSAKIAAYKVCDSVGCDEYAILAAFDDAISDGVDLITVSIGGQYPAAIHRDAVAIGSFHAAVKGILTVQSAGNHGNFTGSVISVAPWVFSVAASTTDRHIIDKVVLGDGKTLIGDSVNSFTLEEQAPLVLGKDVAWGQGYCTDVQAELCWSTCLNPSLVKGKIVLCGQHEELNPAGRAVNEASRAGALGAITVTKMKNVSFLVPLPAAGLSLDDFAAVRSHTKATKSPTARILKSEVLNDTAAPTVAPFSSRGPNYIAADILKPDITAPGVDILAAFSPAAPVTTSPTDKRSVKYSILSGTSMSCPHVAGAAAYVKSLHPNWSPSAIKSALMTTAQPMSATKNPGAEFVDGAFAYGSGHVNPVKAADPGLVFEASTADYIQFLCGLGYTQEKIQEVTGEKTSCPKGKVWFPNDVNYPSFAARVSETKSFSIKFHRTVTNVGVANSTYKANIDSNDSKLIIKVEPEVLSFKSLNETKSFDVTVAGAGLASRQKMSASLIWSDGIHRVRSPIVMYTI